MANGWNHRRHTTGKRHQCRPGPLESWTTYSIWRFALFRGFRSSHWRYCRPGIICDGRHNQRHSTRERYATRNLWGEPQRGHRCEWRRLFRRNDGITGYELWRTDGTAAGTVLVKDIIPGPGPSDPFDAPMELTNVNGMLFFSACASGHLNCELSKCSDGTDAGTMRLKDINPDGASSNPGFFFGFNGIAFFRATEPGSGTELWRSDGTSRGDVSSAGHQSRPCFILSDVHSARVPGRFTLQRRALQDGRYWTTDGTEIGTVAVTDLTTTGPLQSGPFYRHGSRRHRILHLQRRHSWGRAMENRRHTRRHVPSERYTVWPGQLAPFRVNKREWCPLLPSFKPRRPRVVDE